MVTKKNKTTGGYAAYGMYNGRSVVADGRTRAEAMQQFTKMVAGIMWTERRV